MSTKNEDSKSTGSDSFLDRVLRWAMLWGMCGLRGSRLGLWAFLGPIGERLFGFSLEDILAAIERERQEMERQERLRQLRIALRSAFQPALQKMIDVSNALPSLSLDEGTDVRKDSKWREVIVHPSVVLVLGKRGSGKSALGYRLLELFRYGLAAYVLGIPKQAQRLLPDWLGVSQTLEDVPQASIVLIDEAYLTYHSRESLKAQSREMSRIVNLSRQRNQTLIFVTQEARQIDKNVASQANVVVFKEPGMLQLKFDRPELNDITLEAKQAFSNLSGDKRKSAYVYSPDADFAGLIENLLPTFWSSKLSRAFATIEPASGYRSPTRMTKEGKVARAKELRQSGMSYRQIGSMLRVNESTAYNYVNDYPYRT